MDFIQLGVQLAERYHLYCAGVQQPALSEVVLELRRYYPSHISCLSLLGAITIDNIAAEVVRG